MSYLTIKTVFNYSVTISFKICVVACLTYNHCQWRSCYRPRSL